MTIIYLLTKEEKELYIKIPEAMLQVFKVLHD